MASQAQADFTEDQLVSRTDPFAQFSAWFQAAKECNATDAPPAVYLSTSTKDGKPSSRIVLLISHSEKGFKFYSNVDSRKGKELAGNPQACLLLYWPAQNRQVKVEGKVERLIDQKEVTDFFYSLPLPNQASAVIGSHSTEVSGRAQLESMQKEILEKYKPGGVPIPMPEWCGYLLVPSMFEFSQGRRDWLGDRIVFTKDADSGLWVVKRLAP